MWVVYQESGDSTVFADDGWRETRYISEAERFESKGDAVLCAAAMRAAHGGQWHAAKYKEAVRW